MLPVYSDFLLKKHFNGKKLYVRPKIEPVCF